MKLKTQRETATGSTEHNSPLRNEQLWTSNRLVRSLLLTPRCSEHCLVFQMILHWALRLNMLMNQVLKEVRFTTKNCYFIRVHEDCLTRHSIHCSLWNVSQMKIYWQQILCDSGDVCIAFPYHTWFWPGTLYCKVTYGLLFRQGANHQATDKKLHQALWLHRKADTAWEKVGRIYYIHIGQ